MLLFIPIVITLALFGVLLDTLGPTWQKIGYYMVYAAFGCVLLFFLGVLWYLGLVDAGVLQ